MHAAVQQATSSLQQFQRHAAQSLRQHIRAQQQHRPHFCLGQRLAQPARMAAHQVALQRLQISLPMRTSDSLPKPVLIP